MRYEGEGNYLAFWGLLGCRIITICIWEMGVIPGMVEGLEPLKPTNKQKEDGRRIKGYGWDRSLQRFVYIMSLLEHSIKRRC
jgi:hypothetical protein